jgi:sulfatase maturation enzyme AslB (radical SAM superfamily)
MARTLNIQGASDPGVAPHPASAPELHTALVDAPSIPLVALDQLWFQVAGTVCNLRCSHCFISCSPENHSFWFLTREQVAAALAESVGIGVKEYYFTGGEPFMNHEMLGILEDTLRLGPATVLTNATLLPERTVGSLASMARRSSYSLELRVSIDGTTAEMNDAVRGEGAFDRAVEGVGRLVAAGFLPIITAMQTWKDHETPEVLEAFRGLLADVGYHQARIKILPPLRIGAEASRSRGYSDTERITSEMMTGFDADLLLCSRARLVTAQGVWVCPILLDSPTAKVGDSLAEAITSRARLSEQACYTCYVSGAICSNMPGYAQDHS